MKKYLISCVIPNATVNKDFLKALELYAKEQKAEILIYSTKLNRKDNLLDYNLYKQYLKFDNVSLNGKVEIISIAQSHITVNPFTGINNIKSSAIIPFPKMMMKSLPRQIKVKTLPRALFSTGTICNVEGYSGVKSHYKAEEMHSMNGIGALIVEIKNDKFFNCRQIEWKNGEFYDFVEEKKILRYTSKKSFVSKKAKLIIYGDTHLSHADQTVLLERERITKVLQPQQVFHHDILDGSAEFINHHIQNMIQKRMKSSSLSIKQELEDFCLYLVSQMKKFPKTKINIVASNHHEFYERILEDENRLKDVVDFIKKEVFNTNSDKRLDNLVETVKILKEMFNYKFQNKNPLKEYCISRYPALKKVNFLERSDSVIIEGKQLANHGDVGSNGSRGSFNNIKISDPGAFIVGHTHTPLRDEFGGMWVGTSEKFDVDYCNPSGYSSWAHCDVVMYENGACTHVFYLKNDINS